MSLAFAAIVVGLIFLVWSADKFIEGAAVTAKHFGMSPLLIGMVIVGFGTSAPEMVVSALASMQGNPGIALGNAYGSNITNIALILGLTAVISPILVHSQVLRKEMPVLIAITALAAFQLADGQLSRMDAVVLMLVFFMLMGWSIYQGMTGKDDTLGNEMQGEVDAYKMPLKKAIFWLVVGLVVLVLSSRLLVWGAVDIAVALGVSDLIIGLTIVAIGTSLPELASSLMAIKKGEHDMAIGNVIGSNMFNTLTVVGIAGLISPIPVDPEVLQRDIAVMAGLTIVLFIFAYGFRGPGRINRIEGGVLLAAFVAYTTYLITTVIL
ncbi:MAG: calcium/sodium antiporter [Methylophaga sp.]|nr:calcium/sodium antiporter [Methylophaga sp.]